jgi:hypothetical protein
MTGSKAAYFREEARKYGREKEREWARGRERKREREREREKGLKLQCPL